MREKVGKVLVQSKPQVKAAPYIPTYYQVIPRIQCPTSIEVYQIVYIYNVLVSVYIDWHTCIDTCIDTMKSEWIFEYIIINGGVLRANVILVDLEFRAWLGDKSDNVIIVVSSVLHYHNSAHDSYYCDSGHVVTSMGIWHCLASTYPHPREKTYKDGEEEINFDKKLQVFLLEGSRSVIWAGVLGFSTTGGKCSESVSFTIMIVFTVVQVSIKYCDSSKFQL